jgi:hypothetical protein
VKRDRRTRRKASALVYSKTPAYQSRVRRAYADWRKREGLPRRCDNERCRFHRGRMVWNGRTLPLILDHVQGNRCDNRPSMLQLLCPNCDAQLETRGGANKGRVRPGNHGYVIASRDGTFRYTHIPFGGVRVAGYGKAKFVRKKQTKPEALQLE